MNAKHTAGPWCVVLGKNISVAPVGGGQRVALCNYDNGPAEKANASLIAAAPELLEAVECAAAMDLPTEQGWTVLERHGWSRDDRFDLPASVFVRRLYDAAIAKAAGAQS